MSFSRTDEGCLAALTEAERTVLVNVAAQLKDLLRRRNAEGTDAVDDSQPDPHAATLARLLPDAHPDDPEASDEFRRLTESDLVTAKVDNLRVLVRLFDAVSGDEPVTLTDAQAQSVLRALTDVRLWLAVRVGIHTDEDAAQPPDPDDIARHVYEWLGYLQATLIEALS